MSLTANQEVGPANPSVDRLFPRSGTQTDPFRLLIAERSNEGLGQLAGSADDESTQRDAFDELFRRLWRATVEWARSVGVVSQYQAEDAATKAWLRAWRYRHRYDPHKGSYGTWLGTIVRNETLDLLKEESRHHLATIGQTDDLDGSVCVTQEDPDLMALSYVWEAFDALRKAKPDFAAALLLKAEGYPDKQISMMLGLEKVGTVGSRLSRGKKFMAEWLASQGVVFLPQAAIGSVHPWGLNPLSTTSTGKFYSFSPLMGLLVLPTEMANPPGAVRVCDGFFVQVWSYPLDRYRITTSCQTLDEWSQVVFKWNDYVVLECSG